MAYIKTFLLIIVSAYLPIKGESYLFAHGLANTHKQAFGYAPILGTPLVTFDFPDATTGVWRVNWYKTSLGQYNEIGALHNAYTYMEEQNLAQSGIVLMGLSRGAATVINTTALYPMPHVKALILESPYDSVKSIVNKFVHPYLGYLFLKYAPDGIQPCDVVHTIPVDLPILIICSKEDILVPAAASQRLYELLRASGHNHAHILILDHGKHAQLLNSQDGSIYLNAVHAFYKQYGLPYHEPYAQQGECHLNNYLTNVGEAI